jgi:hypothetical protein
VLARQSFLRNLVRRLFSECVRLRHRSRHGTPGQQVLSRPGSLSPKRRRRGRGRRPSVCSRPRRRCRRKVSGSQSRWRGPQPYRRWDSRRTGTPQLAAADSRSPGARTGIKLCVEWRVRHAAHQPGDICPPDTDGRTRRYPNSSGHSVRRRTAAGGLPPRPCGIHSRALQSVSQKGA